MINSFLVGGRACGSKTFSSKCEAQNNGINKTRIRNVGSKKFPKGKLKMSAKSKFDFAVVSACDSGRKTLRVKSISPT